MLEVAAFERPHVMSEAAARACISNINAHASNLFAEVKRLHDFEGWLALGYGSFRECAIAEFKFSKTRVYELLNAAEVLGNFPPMAEKPEDERQLRELAKLRIEGRAHPQPRLCRHRI